jgi:predicted nucleotidyltransferase component of viral defense system
MISKEELMEYAKRKGIKNLGFAELDYFQNLFLFIIYKNYSNEIIFKGGTALYKCFGLDRFSEDLDFNVLKEIKFEKIEKGLNSFKLNYDKEEKNFERSKKIIFRIKGPLYNGTRNSLCKLELDLSLREQLESSPTTKKIGAFTEELPSFEILVMSEKEILAEKFRTILTRNKARDAYDIYHLLKKGIPADLILINKKLSYYSIKYERKDFLAKLKEKKEIWETEMKRLVDNFPTFKEVYALLEKKSPI